MANITGSNTILSNQALPTGIVNVNTTLTGQITGYASPVTNVGGIVATNGYFIIPSAGKYSITADICFVEQNTTGNVTLNYREVVIYRAAANSSNQIITPALAQQNQPATVGTSTYVNVSTTAELCANDLIFVIARQGNDAGASINTCTNGRISIVRIE
jgi:hypothetical protein